MWDLPLPGVESLPSALEAGNLNHWIPREVLRNGILPAISVNKDVTVISNSSAPSVNSWPKGPQEEKAMAPHSSTLAWKIPWTEGPGSLQSMGSLKVDFTFTFYLNALEKEMATHSSVLAWRIPGMGELGGLPSMGLHRVRHNWSDLATAATARAPRKEKNTWGIWQPPGCSHSLRWALRNSGCEKCRILTPDSWDAYERNDFSEPRLSHLSLPRKSLNSLTWDIWFSLINNNCLMFKLPAPYCKASV